MLVFQFVILNAFIWGLNYYSWFKKNKKIDLFDVSYQLAIIAGYSAVNEERYKLLLINILFYAISLFPYNTLKKKTDTK